MINIDQSEAKQPRKNVSYIQLALIIKHALLPRFYQILGQGFSVNAQAGCSIKDFLCLNLGIDAKYLEERIQTIFLNGRAVDDVESAIVEDGSTLALSGPMPGLVGATLRKGGYYAAMRSQISHSKKTSPANNREGKIIIKLFNIIVKELGPAFLHNGIWITGKQLQEGMLPYWDKLKSEGVTIHLNGLGIDIEALAKVDWENKEVFLVVTSE